METKLCRICGKLGQNFVHIFRTEGLKNKIETCLPIVVSQHCLLPDTICGECSENVDNFYSFIKNCLQNIIILEAQYDITESCLKTKRKFEKGCTADFTTKRTDQNIQTDDYLDILLANNSEYDFKYSLTSKLFNKKPNALVDYEINSDESDIDENATGKVMVAPKLEILNKIENYVDSVLSIKQPPRMRSYFDDDSENKLINEISQRKCLKRKGNVIENCCTKIFKRDTSNNRRKNAQPKKLDFKLNESMEVEPEFYQNGNEDNDNHNVIGNSELIALPQICLLCDIPLSGPAALAAHVFEIHGIDMTQIASSSAIEANLNEKKKKIPNLLKISDLKKSDSNDDNQMEEPPTLSPTFVCPHCPAVFSSKSDQFVHLRLKHAVQAACICGICLHQSTSYLNLKTHLETCAQQHSLTTRYLCKICLYGDDNFKWLENHILVHDFLLDACKKQGKMFDPADYIETNEKFVQDGASPVSKSLSCTECGLGDFESFKDFSTHRRSLHSIFHCDLCNKFYGRNSHLWKHVNRLHKGHPSITCQLCYKTSASKYHLAQHFNKIHSAKSCKQKSTSDFLPIEEDFMSQKFQAFDFQSVKQSFMKQELMEQERRNNISEFDDNSNNQSDQDSKEAQPLNAAPKEIDSSSDLYTNIITNYTPPANEGEFKCPKCGKGFHKKTLLKKHKKNCRPRLQKDLLTRCKSCARIFKDRQSLAKHLVNYHSEYACEICNQKVQSKCEIVSHIRFTHPGCHLVCQICGNILRSQADLIEHVRDHLNSYICQFCADALPSKIKLKMHILSLHRKILSLSCGVCLKLFETQHILRDHVKLVHRDQLAPLTSCPVCGKNYGSKWKTYDHLNKSHGRIFRACKTCLEVFDNENQLQAHYETAHVNQTVITVKNSVSNPVNEVGNNYDSESEQENDDNSDEDYQSDNDTKVEPVMNFHSTLSHDTKISLLEKRLLGKKLVVDEDQKMKQPVVNNVARKLSSIKKEDETTNSPNPQINSSKRTVYVNSNDPSYCEICQKTWPAKKHLWQHYIRCHKSVAATVCGICLKTNTNYITLQQHLRETHPLLLHGQGFGSNFICRICGRYHNASSKLKLHMAIHENFDWSMIDKIAPKVNNASKPNNTIKQETNGFRRQEEPKPEVEQEVGELSINYESLIEQVECTSQSEQEDSDDGEEQNVLIVKQEDEEESSTEDEDDDVEEDSCDSENSLELNLLQDGTEVKKEVEAYGSTSEETSSSFSDERNIVVKSEDDLSQESTLRSNSTTVDSTTNGNLFRCKPEELDSAIKSISYECMEQPDENIVDDYCDVQSQSLNDNEIESAVGSIL